MTRICSPRSTSPRRRELSSLAGERTISINRVPVPLWAWLSPNGLASIATPL